jgi:hypothetical protein
MNQAPQPTGPTPEQIAAISNLKGAIRPLLACHIHEVALTALLQLYLDGALHHSCCTEGCASACMGVAMHLAIAAKTALPAPGTPIH